MAKKKLLEGTKRVLSKGKYVTVLYKEGKKIGSTRWRGSNKEAESRILHRSKTRPAAPTPAPTPAPSRGIPTREISTNFNIAYNELVFYSLDRVGSHSYYLEVRFHDVVLPAGMGAEDLTNVARELLGGVSNGSISMPKIGSSGGYPTSREPTRNISATLCVKTAGAVSREKANSPDGKYQWVTESRRVNIL